MYIFNINSKPFAFSYSFNSCTRIQKNLSDIKVLKGMSATNEPNTMKNISYVRLLCTIFSFYINIHTKNHFGIIYKVSTTDYTNKIIYYI